MLQKQQERIDHVKKKTENRAAKAREPERKRQTKQTEIQLRRAAIVARKQKRSDAAMKRPLELVARKENAHIYRDRAAAFDRAVAVERKLGTGRRGTKRNHEGINLALGSVRAHQFAAQIVLEIVDGVKE